MKQLFLLLILCSSVFTANAQTHERWNVKTLTDGFAPDLNNVQPTSVAKMGERQKVKVGDNDPRKDFEMQVITISGTIKDIVPQTEAGGDGDYHIEISDGTLVDSTFVCEAVDPNDEYASQSPYIKEFKKVREFVVAAKKGDHVTFTGVVFQDKFHKPSKHRTRNFLEMHPILFAE